MRRTFEVRRETSEQPDGQDRWDQAYQLVLRWAVTAAGEPEEERPMRVALYVRVSTDRQQQAQTIEQQVTQLQTYVAAREGWTVREEHVFRDDGYSGAKLERPGLDACATTRRGPRSTWCWSPPPTGWPATSSTRWWCSRSCSATAAGSCSSTGRCSDDPHEQLVLQIRGAVAEYERTLIADRMRRGRQARLRGGQLLPWTRAPYGYRLDPERPRDPAAVQVDPVGRRGGRKTSSRRMPSRRGDPARAGRAATARRVPTPTGQADLAADARSAGC